MRNIFKVFLAFMQNLAFQTKRPTANKNFMYFHEYAAVRGMIFVKSVSSLPSFYGCAGVRLGEHFESEGIPILSLKACQFRWHNANARDLWIYRTEYAAFNTFIVSRSLF